MTILHGALACVLALIVLCCAISLAYEAVMEEQEEDLEIDVYLTELRFTSQGRVLRVEHYDETEV